MATQTHALLHHQNIGDSFQGVYYVEQAYVKKTVQQKDYLDIILRDKSGPLSVKYWGTIPGLEKGNWVFVAAHVEDYLGAPSSIAKNIDIVEEPDDLSPYIPIYEDIDKYAEGFDKIRDVIKTLEDKTKDYTAGMLIDEVYGNSKFFDKFLQAPGGIGPHYGRQGGLLANTVRVANACKNMSTGYNLKDEDKIILLSAALLARIGAIDSYVFQDCVPVETKPGILLGLNNLTMTRVSSALKRMIASLKKKGEAPNQDMVIRLLHAVTAFDGVCVTPATREAMLLNSVYKTDLELVNSIEFIEQDVNINEQFTAYDPATRRRYYTG